MLKLHILTKFLPLQSLSKVYMDHNKANIPHSLSFVEFTLPTFPYGLSPTELPSSIYWNLPSHLPWHKETL